MELKIVFNSEASAESILIGRTCFVGASVRNKRFSAVVLENMVRVINALRSRAVFCVVDSPYVFNILATTSSLHEIKGKVDILFEQSRILSARLKRACSESAGCQVLEWSDLVLETPSKFRVEVARAFSSDLKFRDRVRAEVESRIPSSVIGPHNVDLFANFFVTEFPVICNLMFGPMQAVDLYPGEICNLFIELASGAWRDELPLLTELAMGSSNWAYVEIPWE